MICFSLVNSSYFLSFSIHPNKSGHSNWQEIVSRIKRKEPTKAKAQKRLRSEADHTDALDISLYPNPTNGQLTLNYQLEENQSAFLRVFDLMGNLVIIKTLNVGATHNIDMEELSKGIYFVEIHNSIKPLFKEKIVLQ